MQLSFLPMFPLSIVVFQNEQVNLHIFEPRYKQLINECLENKTTFGIPSFINKKVMNMGAEMKVLSLDRQYPDGRMDIKTKALCIFKIEEFYATAQDKLYPGAMVNRLEFDRSFNPLLEEEIKKQVDHLYKNLRIDKKFPNYKSFSIAHHIGMSKEQEYQVLCIGREADRQAFILEHLKKVVPIIIETEALKAKIKMNGHFKNFEQLDF